MTQRASRQKPVALVTGCSSGFGLLAAVELARSGHHVLASMRDLSRQEALLREARAASVEVEPLALDATSAASVDAAVALITERYGRIDLLVNNAGVGLAGFFEDVTLDETRALFETNFFGVVELTRRVVPLMRAQGRGRILVVSSKAGRVPTLGISAYCASKWALEGLFEALRFELAPHGISVVLVEPGMYRTDIFARNRKVAARAFDPSSANYQRSLQLERYVDDNLERSRQDPREVARLIARVAVDPSPRLRYLVGRDAKREAWARERLPEWLYARIVRRVADKIFRP
jgi:NAD(P)-dependent dehydrogenase (short-subunit alcohol dehydrogenase family)